MLMPYRSDKFCWALDRVYLKANGRLACWCHAGEAHTIIKPANFLTADFVVDVINSAEMRQMRLTFLQDNQPYIKQCQDCCCYLEQGKATDRRYPDSPIARDVQQQANIAYEQLRRVQQQRHWSFGSIDTISEIQVEPAFPCTLRCPACVHGWHEAPLTTEEPPYLLSLDWFRHMIDCCVKHAVRIERIHYCGRGEPTLNKRLPEMIVYAHSKLPQTLQSMDTNCNQEFVNDYLLLDHINCSIDGSTQDAYESYRRRGNWQKALNFMRTAVEQKKAQQSTCSIRWKYILLSVTEDPKSLMRTQEMAKEIGIDELDFVITSCASNDGSVLPPQQLNTTSAVKKAINLPLFENTMVSYS